MTRIIKNESWHGSAEGAADALLPYRPGPDWEEITWAWRMALQRKEKNEKSPFRIMREKSPFRIMQENPYKVGDIIRCNAGICRIYEIVSYDMVRHDYYIPCYRVQWITKSGNWSRQWRATYPGWIERAYQEAA